VADEPRNYSDDEVEAIFRRALERQAASGDGLEHEDLVAAAREVGLDERQIARAVHEMEQERGEEDLRLTVKRRQRDAWLRHLITYLVIAGGALGIHLLGLTGAWAIWMALGWGAGLSLHTFSVARGPSEEAVAKERTKRNRRARREARARARHEAARREAEERAMRAQRRGQKSVVEDELERVIEEGVTLLLGAAAKKLREATSKLEERPPETDFERFVKAKRAGRPTADTSRAPRPTPPTRPQVRVAMDDEPLDAERDRGLVHRDRSGRCAVGGEEHLERAAHREGRLEGHEARAREIEARAVGLRDEQITFRVPAARGVERELRALIGLRREDVRARVVEDRRGVEAQERQAFGISFRDGAVREGDEVRGEARGLDRVDASLTIVA
jgi:hypothetical protein